METGNAELAILSEGGRKEQRGGLEVLGWEWAAVGVVCRA
jgi:hypothetical protein